MIDRSNTAQQTKINLYTNLINLVASVIVGIFYTPYLVNQLGIIAYGVVPLALIINQYISVVTGSLTSSFTRFYSVAIQRGETSSASENLSTALYVVGLIVVFLMPFLIWIIWQIDSFFTIPIEYVNSAKLLFAFTILSFFISLFTSLLNVTLYALNRLDLMNVIKISRIILKFGIVIFLFQCISINVAYVGVAGFITEFSILLLSIFFFIKYKPDGVRLQLNLFNKSILIAILGMTIWTIIHQIGDTTLYRIDNVIINKFFGIEASGTLGAVSEFGTYVLIVVSVIGSLFGPLILIAYSKKNHDEVKSLAVNQSYIVGAISAVLAGVLAGYADSIVSIWLGPKFSEYGGWLLIKLIYVPFYAAGGVLAYVYRTWNKVRMPAIMTLIIGLINLFIVLIIAHFMSDKNQIEYILIICSVLGVVQCYFLNCYCVYRIYNSTGKPLMLSALKIILILFLTYIICKYIDMIISIENALQLMTAILVSGIIVFAITYLMAFSKLNKNQIKSIIFK